MQTSTGRPESLGAWLNLVQAHAAVLDSLEAKLERESGIHVAWHEVLVRLAGAEEGRLRMFDLAQLLLLSKSGATRLIDRMQAAGLVDRGGCESDRRVTYAMITPKGREALAVATPVYLEGVREYFSRHLTDRDVASLRISLRKLLEGNGQWTDHRCSPPQLEGSVRAKA